MMSKDMLKKWNTVHHRYKHLITEEMLACGTGHNLREEDYPEDIKAMAKITLDKR